MADLADRNKQVEVEIEVLDDGDGERPGSAEASPKVSAPAKEVSGSVTRRLRTLNVNSVRSFRPNICRVPKDIRGDNGSAYDPKLISIGPYHRGEETLLPMEEVKLLYLHDLLQRDGYNEVQYYAEAIFKREVDARREYAGPVNPDSKEFVEMLVVDACFVVEFFLKRAEGKVGPPLTGQLRNLPTLRHDLLLLENQIPFFVLRTILEESAYEFPGSDGIALLDLALHYLQKGKVTKEMLGERYQKGDGERIYHLLHLSYLCLLQGLKPEIPRIEPPPETLALYLIKNFKGKASRVARFFLYLAGVVRRSVSFMLIFLLYVVVSFFEVVLVWRRPGWSTSGKKPAKKPRMLPTATELREAGVVFKRKDNVRCYLDVSFKDGTLEIPKLHIQENSTSEFRNFLALEQNCPDVGNYFTSYVVLMDNLVDTVADVSVLKRAGILESKLGCDADVAKFFNGMRSGLCFNFDRHYLVGLFEDLNDYCNQEHNRWRAKLMHDYFSNPWTIFSVIGAVVLLILTALQTVYTINGASDSSSSLGPKSAAPSPTVSSMVVSTKVLAERLAPILVEDLRVEGLAQLIFVCLVMSYESARNSRMPKVVYHCGFLAAHFVLHAANNPRRAVLKYAQLHEERMYLFREWED